MKHRSWLVLLVIFAMLAACGDTGDQDAATLDGLSDAQLAKVAPDLLEALDLNGSVDIIVQVDPQVVYEQTLGPLAKRLEADPAVIWKARQDGAVIWKLAPEQAVIWKMSTDEAVIWKFTDKLVEVGLEADQVLESIHAVTMHANIDDVSMLATLGEVAYITPDREVEISGVSLTKATLGGDMVTTRTGSSSFTGLTGAGVGIAIVDSGLDTTHPDFVGRVVAKRNFTSIYVNNVTDGYGHGTHVAGLLGGTGKASYDNGYNTTFEGVAPGASLIVAKVLDSSGSGSVSGTIASLQWLLSIKNTYNIRVVNLSLGLPPFDPYALDPLCAAVENAVANGLVVVTAAGNYGYYNGQLLYGAIASPGITPAAITVGASNSRGTIERQQDAVGNNDTVAFFSSRGPTAWNGLPKPDLVAPGWEVISTFAANSALGVIFPNRRIDACTYGGSPCGASNAQYFKMSGTSMSAPLVAGAAALLLQANPSLTPGAIKTLLMTTSEPLFEETSSTLCYSDVDWRTNPACHALMGIEQGSGLLNLLGVTFLAGAVSPETNLLDPGDDWLAGEGITPLSFFSTTGDSVVWSQGLAWTGKGIVGCDIWETFQEAYEPGTVWSQGLAWTGKGIWYDIDPVFDPSIVAVWSTSFLNPYSLVGDNTVLGGYSYDWAGIPEYSTSDDAWFPES